jgi:tetratricopeptide (TPR) repeat protein
MTDAKSKRLAFLEKTVSEGSTDPFVLYALALEYKSIEQLQDSIQVFSKLRQNKPDYVPMYLMCGQVLEKAGQKDEAREWYQAGIAAARAKSESHAQTELEAALAALA